MDSNEDGRSAMINLRTHYDGPGAVLTRIASANQVLKTIHYNQEQSFPFEKYVTKLKESFEVLEENGEGKTEAEKVRIMLENIRITNNEVQAAQTFVAMNPSLSKNFEDAANALSERVAILYPNIKEKYKEGLEVQGEEETLGEVIIGILDGTEAVVVDATMEEAESSSMVLMYQISVEVIVMPNIGSYRQTSERKFMKKGKLRSVIIVTAATLSI